MEDGRLVVVVFDFCATCFMPLSFIQVALKKPRDRFCQSVEERIGYPYKQPKGFTLRLWFSCSVRFEASR